MTREHITKGNKWKNTDFLIGASTFDLFKTKKSNASFPLPNGGFYENYNTSMLLTSDKKIDLRQDWPPSGGLGNVSRSI